MTEALLQTTELENLATAIGATPAQAALAWMMAKGVSVIPKSTKESRLIENFNAQTFIEAVKSHPDLVAAIDALPDWPDGVTDGPAYFKKQKLRWDVERPPRMGL